MSQSPESALRVQRYEDGWEAINRMIREDLSWGGYERKCFHVACEDGTFASVAGAAGVDYLDDGRALCILDHDQDGAPDLLLRNRTGPQLRLLRNVWPRQGKSLWIRCEGTRSNRDAIGARVTLRGPGWTRAKEVAAGNLFLSQSSRWLCFGLGAHSGPVEAEVRWPGGPVQQLGPLEPGHRYHVREGEAPVARPFAPQPGGSVATSGEAPPTTTGPAAEQGAVATWLVEPLPAPDFQLPALPPAAAGTRVGPSAFRGQPLVLCFLSMTCPACEREMEAVRQAESRVAAAGGRILHVIVDAGATREACEAFVRQHRLAAPAVQATPRELLAYNIVHRHLFSLRRDLAVPSSFLLDAAGSIVRVYRGGAAAQWAADLRRIPATPDARLAAALPFPGTLHRDTFRRDLLGLGNAFFEAGLLAEASAVFHRPVAGNPEDVDSLFNAAVTAAEEGRIEEAAAGYRQALALAPGLDDARNNLGILLARQGRGDEAMALFTAVLERNPAHAEAVLNVSNELLRADRAGEAAAVCLAALRLDPESAPFHRQLAYAQFRAGRRDEAIATGERALALDPLDLEARLNLANFVAAEGQWERARELATAGLKRNSAHAGLLNTLGMAQAALGQPAEAVAAFEAAIAAEPALDRPYLNLAKLHLERGEPAKARAVLERLLRVAPDHPGARQLLEGVR